jgi:hypothetical protein
VTDQDNIPLQLKTDWTIGLKFEFLVDAKEDESIKILQEIRDLVKYVTIHKFIK